MTDFRWQDDRENRDEWITDPFQDIRLDVPLNDVDALPKNCVEISEDWVPIILSALERLKYGDMWNGDATDLQRAHQNINLLQKELMDGQCVGTGQEGGCWDLPLFSPTIDWLPADPFKNPLEVPFGYSTPPWIVETINDPVYGTRPGDVFVSVFGGLVAFPPLIPASGVPRIQISVDGEATVDLELVRVLQGGIAIILVDGLPKHWFDLQLYNVGDLLNVTNWAETFGFLIETFTRTTLQAEIVVSGPGQHVIEIQILPRVGGLLSLGYGGGLRKVQVCAQENPVDLTGVITDIRIQNGQLEKFVDAAWADVGAIDQQTVFDPVAMLRGNGCFLEHDTDLDLTWVPIPGAKWLHPDTPCDITALLTIDKTGWPAFQNRDNGVLGLRFGAIGSKAFYNGETGLELHISGNPMGFKLVEPALMLAVENEAGAIAKGFFTVRNDSANTPLAVWNYLDKANRIQQWFDGVPNPVVEISKEGWFSATQQLIVNALTSTAVNRAQGRLLGQWADDTDATRKGRLALQVDDFGGAREAMRAEADGSDALLGFFGSGAIARPLIARDYTAPDDDTRILLTELHNLGLIQWVRATLPLNMDWSFLHTSLLPDEGLDAWTTEDAADCGNYVQGTGLVGEANCGVFNYRGRWAYDFDSSATLENIRYVVHITTAFTLPLTVRLNRGNQTALKSDTIDPASIGTYSFTWAGSAGESQIELQLDSANSGGVAHISEVQISGTGTYPGPVDGFEL